MPNPDSFATHEFGWTQEEFGDSDLWLDDMRKMLERESSAVYNNTKTPKSYGYITMTKQQFLKAHAELITKINDVLGVH